MRRVAWAVALGVALLLLLASAAAHADTLVDYTVREGDTCAAIARRLWGDSKRVDLIHANNALGRTPHHLVPGTILHLPAPVSGPDALLTFVRNIVDTFTPERAVGRKDDPLKRGDRVATETRASAEVTFRDTSRLQLGEETLIVILESANQAERGGDDTTLVNGRLRAFLDDKPDARPRQLRTDSARVQLGPGEMQLHVDDKKAARLAVYRGKGSLAAQRKTVAVQAGFGSKAELGQAPTPPRPLPPAPIFTTAPPSLVLDRTIAARYAAGAGAGPPAARWHVQIASDLRFNALATDATVPANITELRAQGLTPGQWYVRVSAIDADQFEGPFSTVATVQVALTRREPSELPGHVRVVVDAGGLPLSCAIGDAPLQPVTGPLDALAWSETRLRCAAGPDGAGAAAAPVAPADVALAVDAHRDGGALEARLRDPHGALVHEFPLAGSADSGVTIGPFSERDGVYRATITPAAAGAFRLKLAAAGGVWSQSVAVAALPPPPEIVTSPPTRVGLGGGILADTGSGAVAGTLAADVASHFAAGRGFVSLTLRAQYERHSPSGVMPALDAGALALTPAYHFPRETPRLEVYVGLRPELVLLGVAATSTLGRFGFGGVVGVEAQLTPRWAAFLEASYRYVFAAPVEAAARASSIGLSAGVRLALPR